MIRYMLCFLLSINVLYAAAEDDPLVNLKKGQPNDVAALIERRVGCNHWGGEEPYDGEREKEISSAVAHLKCGRLATDESILIKRYAKKPKALKALKKAKDMSY
ncbi:MAG: hypothetical protein V4568_09775 [Pseudomonadota bacterium]